MFFLKQLGDHLAVGMLRRDDQILHRAAGVGRRNTFATKEAASFVLGPCLATVILIVLSIGKYNYQNFIFTFLASLSSSVSPSTRSSSLFLFFPKDSISDILKSKIQKHKYYNKTNMFNMKVHKLNA